MPQRFHAAGPYHRDHAKKIQKRPLFWDLPCFLGAWDPILGPCLKPWQTLPRATARKCSQ